MSLHCRVVVRQAVVCGALLLCLQREVWHSRAPLSAFLRRSGFSNKSRLSMQVSQEEGKHWSAARPPKRRVRLGDLRHFHTLFAWRSYLELWSALYHFVCFFFLAKWKYSKQSKTSLREKSLTTSPEPNWHLLWTPSVIGLRSKYSKHSSSCTVPSRDYNHLLKK